MTDIELRDLDVLVELLRPFSSRRIINCLEYEDVNLRVFSMFFD